LLADLGTRAVEDIYPSQWIEQSPGSFTYTYFLTSTTRKSIYLAIDSGALGQKTISSIEQAPHVFDTLNLPSLLTAGQPLSLQLNSSVVSFAGLAGNSTGWRVWMYRPDGSTADLGLMADWAVAPGPVYKWNMTVPGNNLTQVSRQQMSLHRRPHEHLRAILCYFACLRG
jgi:hypothetical protein